MYSKQDLKLCSSTQTNNHSQLFAIQFEMDTKMSIELNAKDVPAYAAQLC